MFNNNFSLGRRKFLQGIGLLFGSMLTSGAGLMDHASAKGKKSVVARNNSGRYPWWVSERDTITTEIDRNIIEPFEYLDNTANLHRYLHRDDFETMELPNIGIIKYVGGRENLNKLWRKRQKRLNELIKNNVPGHSLKEWALAGAADALWLMAYFDFDEMMQKTNFTYLSEQYGTGKWKGNPEEASKMVEAAVISYGASQVGFTTVDNDILYNGVEYPSSLKYVIVILTEWAPESIKRADTPLGLAGNRMQIVRENITVWATINFIRMLGYTCDILQAPWPPYGVFAGLGEMGRMNRMISPIYGGAIDVFCLVTDMPLAVHKPIDFGLQTFCKYCKKCAEVCPAGAISFADNPTWEPKGMWNAPGKKVYYEESPKCSSYMAVQATQCSLCLANCPWTKQDKTALHDIAKSFSSNIPLAGGLVKVLDDIFGYGTTKDPDDLQEWWDLELPTYGIDTKRKG